MSLATRTTEYMRLHGMLSRGASYLAAVSGGIDSVVLAHILSGLRKSWGIQLHLAYVNHGLREAAKNEAGFVQSLAEEMRVSCHIIEVDVRGARESSGGSIQDVARRLRYDVLERLRLEQRLQCTATAHHAGDQAETLAAHFFAGAGPGGLAGIRPIAGSVIRPLLTASRKDIEAYVSEHELRWMEDESNKERYYARNRIRLDVIPVLKAAVNPSIEKTLSKSAELFHKFEEFHSAHARRLFGAAVREADGCFYLAEKELKGYFEAEMFLVVKLALERAGCERVEYSQVEQVTALFRNQTGAVAQLPGEIQAVRERDGIAIVRKLQPAPSPAVVRAGDSIEWNGFRLHTAPATREEMAFSRDGRKEYADASVLGGSWTLRRWQPGDTFQPVGFRGRVRISDYLSDAGIPAFRKQDACVLVNDDGIAWLCGYRLDDRVKVTGSTAQITVLTFEPIQ